MASKTLSSGRAAMTNKFPTTNQMVLSVACFAVFLSFGVASSAQQYPNEPVCDWGSGVAYVCNPCGPDSFCVGFGGCAAPPNTTFPDTSECDLPADMTWWSCCPAATCILTANQICHLTPNPSTATPAPRVHHLSFIAIFFIVVAVVVCACLCVVGVVVYGLFGISSSSSSSSSSINGGKGGNLPGAHQNRTVSGAYRPATAASERTGLLSAPGAAPVNGAYTPAQYSPVPAPAAVSSPATVVPSVVSAGNAAAPIETKPGDASVQVCMNCGTAAATPFQQFCGGCGNSLR